MSIQAQRVIWEDDTTLKDISVDMCDFRQGEQTIEIVAADDRIYLGSFLPFNHRWIDIGTANSNASAVTVEIWWSEDWTAAVDVIDETSSSGVALAQDGYLRWNTEIERGWDKERESEDVTGLTGTSIYNMYWVRLTYSADFSAGTSLKYIGHKFADDDTLYGYYADLQNTTIQDAYESGKTDWNEQHYMAAQEIIKDLRTRNIVVSADQILDPELFEIAAVHKAAEIIYRGMGSEFRQDKSDARKAYNEAISRRYFNIDLDGDARLDSAERIIQTSLTR